MENIATRILNSQIRTKRNIRANKTLDTKKVETLNLVTLSGEEKITPIILNFRGS